MKSIPHSWKMVRLGQVCSINPRERSTLSSSALVSFIPMAAVDEASGTIVSLTNRTLSEVQKGFTPFSENDVLFAKITPCMENGKVAIARGLTNGVGFGSTEFHVIRPAGPILSEYIYFIVRNYDFRKMATGSFQGAVGQQRVPASFIENFKIPLPPLGEQRRIVAILQEAEEVRRLRANLEGSTERLSFGIFTRVFGPPDSWGNGQRLNDAVSFVGGGTPSRTVAHYFHGTIPWATPKDMKRLYLVDTEEHISVEAIEASATCLVPAGTVLVVVKSKILSRTLPLAISPRPMCFGQDLKGLIPRQGIPPEFIVYSLRAQLGRILSRARGANTEGLTLEALRPLPIPPINTDLIDKFWRGIQEIKNLNNEIGKEPQCFGELTASLSAHALSGALTAAWRNHHRDQLTSEAAELDAWLAHEGVRRSASLSGTASISFSGSGTLTAVRSGLSREQNALLNKIEELRASLDLNEFFTSEILALCMDDGLRHNARTIEGHLTVLADRGLVIPFSHEVDDPRAGTIFAKAYRLPRNEDRRRSSEISRLAASLGAGSLR